MPRFFRHAIKYWKRSSMTRIKGHRIVRLLIQKIISNDGTAPNCIRQRPDVRQSLALLMRHVIRARAEINSEKPNPLLRVPSQKRSAPSYSQPLCRIFRRERPDSRKNPAGIPLQSDGKNEREATPCPHGISFRSRRKNVPRDSQTTPRRSSITDFPSAVNVIVSGTPAIGNAEAYRPIRDSNSWFPGNSRIGE